MTKYLWKISYEQQYVSPGSSYWFDGDAQVIGGPDAQVSVDRVKSKVMKQTSFVEDDDGNPTKVKERTKAFRLKGVVLQNTIDSI